MQKVFTANYKVNMYDVDAPGRVKMSRVMEHLLVAANDHSDELGWSHEYLEKEHNICMVLLLAHIEIKGKIAINDNITLKTWAEPRVYPLIVRHFVAYNGENVVYEAIVHCGLMDITERTMVNGNNYGLTLPEVEGEVPETTVKIERIPRKYLLSEEHIMIKDFLTGYSDLDYNGHVNSARYIDFLEDTVNGTFRKIDIQYTNEIKPLSPVKVEVNGNPDEEEKIAVGKCDGKIQFVCKYLM